ncbi:MAG: LON peptidase substrate-binding domain-containing protein [Anaerolineae bacterium]
MFELPLFPLNTVLFPGMPLNLRIFEDRYKLMMNLCIEKRQPFGVVLIANDVPDTSMMAETHLVGCTAQITQVQPLSQGRMNIAAIGRDRFRIDSFKRDEPYLVGMVEMFPMEDEKTVEVMRKAARLRKLLEKYLFILKEAGQIQFDAAQLPRDSASVTYLSAILLQNLTTEDRQRLLETENMLAMIENLNAAYRREVALLDILMTVPENIDFKGLFSLS